MKHVLLSLLAGAFLASLTAAQTCGTCPFAGACAPTGPPVPMPSSNHTCENWSGVNLFVPDITGADFSQAMLVDANFFQASAKNGFYVGAGMKRFSAQGAQFNKSDFTDADLRQARLWGANLKQAVLRNADLRGADLSGCDVDGADFAGADMSTIYGLLSTVGSAQYNCQTQFPEGFDPKVELSWDKTGCFPEFYGCGNNPEEALVVIEGQASLNNTLKFGIDNVFGTQNPGSLTGWIISAAPSVCISVPWNMQGQGLQADLLVDIFFHAPMYVGGPNWTGAGTPAVTNIKIPKQNPLVGVNLYVQGLMVDPTWAPDGVEYGLTPAFKLEIGKEN